MLAAFSPLKPVRADLLEGTLWCWRRRMRRDISNDPRGQFRIRCLKWAQGTSLSGTPAQVALTPRACPGHWWCLWGEQLLAGVRALCRGPHWGLALAEGELKLGVSGTRSASAWLCPGGQHPSPSSSAIISAIGEMWGRAPSGRAARRGSDTISLPGLTHSSPGCLHREAVDLVTAFGNLLPLSPQPASAGVGTFSENVRLAPFLSLKSFSSDCLK